MTITSFQSALTDPSLEAFYPGDADLNGTPDSNDYTGTYPLTWSGVETFADGKWSYGKALSTNQARNPRIANQATIGAAIVAAGTFATHFKSTNIDVHANTQNIFGPDLSLYRFLGVRATNTTTGYLYAEFKDSGGTTRTLQSAAGSVIQGQYHHAALVWEDGFQGLYLDGELADFKELTIQTSPTPTSGLGIGGYVGGANGNRFDGEIYVPFIFSRACEASEIPWLAANPNSELVFDQQQEMRLIIFP